MDLNMIVLAGVLAAPPEIRHFASGTTMARLLVVVKSTSLRRRVDVVPVTLWEPGRRDNLPSERGDRVWVVGSVQRRFWADGGGRRSRIEVVAHEVQRRPDGDSEEVQRTA